MELENKSDKGGQKQQENYEFKRRLKIKFFDDWHSITNMLFFIFYVAFIVVYITLLRKYHYEKVANGIIIWLSIGFLLLTIVASYKTYNYIIGYINGVFDEGKKYALNENKSKIELLEADYLNEIVKAKEEGIQDGKKLRKDIQEIKTEIENFKDFLVVEKGFTEEHYTRLFDIFKEHPNTWKEFIKRSYPSENGVSYDLWKELTAVLICEHLITLQNLRKSTP